VIFKKKKKNDIPKRRSIKQIDESSEKPSTNLFKRNRTLTGTTSNRLKSVNTNNELESPRVHAHNLTIKRRKIGSILLLILIIAAPIWFLINNFTATVNIEISDVKMSKSIDTSKYEKAIQDYLNINPMSRFSFFLDINAMGDYVSSKLPEVSNIDKIITIAPGKVNFTLKMRTPVAGWQINDKQYYVDSKGIPFEKNYFTAPSVQIVDNSVILPKVGTAAIASNRFLSFVGRVVSVSKTYGYTVIQASLPNNTTRELEVKLKEGNYIIKLSIDRPVGEQIEDMANAIKYFTNSGQTPEYIDVRVSGKAFYK
jgi:cell division septal protein FtsQ